MSFLGHFGTKFFLHYFRATVKFYNSSSIFILDFLYFSSFMITGWSIFSWGHLYLSVQFSSVQSLSHVRPFVTPWTTAHQASLSITNSQSSPKPMSIVLLMPSNHLILSSPSPPAFNLSQHQGLFKWVSSSHQVAKILVCQLQHQAFQWTPRTDLLYNALVGSPCSTRDSQESSPTPQFRSINSLVLSFLYSPTLTSIHDHWKNHSPD